MRPHCGLEVCMSLTSLLALPALGLAFLEITAATRGDAKLRLATEEISDKTIDFPTSQHARLRFNIPFSNIGVQQALIIDCIARLQPSGLRYSDLQPTVRLNNPVSPRKDGYWEATIVKQGKKMVIGVELWLSVNNSRQAVEKLDKLTIEILYKYYCRTPMKYCRTEITIDPKEFEEIPYKPDPKLSVEPVPKDLGSNTKVEPIRTHIFMPGEDIIANVKRYTEGKAKPGDIIALAESPVAIMQKRLAYCEDIKPRYLARRLNWFFAMDSSLSSVYSLEMAFREIGTPRMLLSFAAGLLGKLRHKPGEFYRVAGRSVATIDDCTGTLPPFDKHVIMGPANGQQLCEEIYKATGIDCTIVDANDLGKVDVLALSDPTRKAEVEEALKINPAGNASEMTPIVIIHKQGAEQA